VNKFDITVYSNVTVIDNKADDMIVLSTLHLHVWPTVIRKYCVYFPHTSGESVRRQNFT
jgi:hypothetical protein